MNKREALAAALDLIHASREVPVAPDRVEPADPFAGVPPDELARRATPEAFREAAHRMVGQTGRGHSAFPVHHVDIVRDEEDGGVRGAWVTMRVYVTAFEALRHGQPEGLVWPPEGDER